MSNNKGDSDQERYFTLDILTNAIDSLEKCRLFLKENSELKWKWIASSLLHSLYLFCINTLEHGNYDNVLTYSENEDNERYILIGNDTKWKKSRKIYRENSEGYTIKWDYIDGIPSFPKKRGTKIEDTKKLINFWTAFARVQDEEVDGAHYIFSKPLIVTEEQWVSIEQLYEMVNTIIFYIQCLWSFEIDEFKANFK